MNDAESRADSEVQRAIAVLNGTVSYHTENNLNHLARHEQQLLETIVEQAAADEAGRKFWQYQLQCYAMPSVPPKNKYGITQERYLARLRAFTVLRLDATRLMRTHRGNPDWAIFKLMCEASERCADGGLEPTREMLLASLYAGVITGNECPNDDGRRNELLLYIREHLSDVEAVMDRLSTPDLTVALLEATINKTLHSGLRTGWL